MKLDHNHTALLLIGAGAVAIVAYLAKSSTGGTSVPQFQTEEQFGGVSVDIGDRTNAGTPLDLTPELHYFHVGYTVPGQELVQPRLKYPVVTGANLTAVINHGMSAMAKRSPDNKWRTQPPSEYTI